MLEVGKVGINDDQADASCCCDFSSAKSAAGIACVVKSGNFIDEEGRRMTVSHPPPLNPPSAKVTLVQKMTWSKNDSGASSRLCSFSCAAVFAYMEPKKDVPERPLVQLKISTRVDGLLLFQGH
jgi:hypothetical protein